MQSYGIDYDGPVPLEYDEEPEGVTVPVTNQPCSDERYQELLQLINPLRDSDRYGIDILLDVLAFLS